MQTKTPLMTRAEFLNRFEAILEMEPGSLTGEEPLDGLGSWDSLTLMGFIAMVDEVFGERFSGKQITACRTVNDLANLLGERLGG